MCFAAIALVLPYHIRTLSTPRKLAYDVLSNWTRSELLGVLELAHRWDFDKIKDMIIEKLGACGWEDCVERILVAHKYEITQWYQSAYEALARREKPLTDVEIGKLGSTFAAKMGEIREKWLRLLLATGSTGYTCDSCGYTTYDSNAQRLFEKKQVDKTLSRCVTKVFKL